MALTCDDIRKLAVLSRLELSEDELRALAPQLEKILGFVEQLSEIDTDEVDPMTTALDVENRWRADLVVQGLDRDAALQNAPDHDAEFFLVPPVLGPGASRK